MNKNLGVVTFQKTNLEKIMLDFDLWSKLSLHYEQRPLNHDPWVFRWSHPKSRVP
jgi:hypothetical protein